MAENNFGAYKFSTYAICQPDKNKVCGYQSPQKRGLAKPT